MVRPFTLDDLGAAARFCAAARRIDPSIEPFGDRLEPLALGPRAALGLWRVAESGGELRGIAFVAERATGVLDFYAAVDPSMRRQGLGRALAQPALETSPVLRSRIGENARPGCAFLRASGFSERGAQLALQWRGRIEGAPAPDIRDASERDRAALRRLSEEAWSGAPDAFASRPEEIDQLFEDASRVVRIAESQGRPVGYLSGRRIEGALAIEEVAVLPRHRRGGIARALLTSALAGVPAAVLNVDETNRAALGLYGSFGFTQVMRRLVFERRD